ncbi:radial spoke head 14 homolog [Argonauta hians]
MSDLSIGPDPPPEPTIDPTRATTAFGDRTLPRLERELKSMVLLTRQRALKALSNILHDPEYIAGSIKIGITNSLRELLYDRDVHVKQLAVECIRIIASYAIGRAALVKLELVQPLASLFDDQSFKVRLEAHKTMVMLTSSPLSFRPVLRSDLIENLVRKLPKEEPEILIHILESLHQCMMEDTVDALDAGAMKELKALLNHNSVDICARAAICILDLSVPLRGKDQAVMYDVIDPLTSLLKHPSSEVRAKAAGALAMITITTPGKLQSLSALPTLVQLTEDSCSEVRTNALKALTCLSEAPAGRSALQCCVQEISNLTSDPNPAVAKAARIAVEVICWKP